MRRAGSTFSANGGAPLHPVAYRGKMGGLAARTGVRHHPASGGAEARALASVDHKSDQERHFGESFARCQLVGKS